MLLPISWLKDFVDVSKISLEELERQLFSIGFEVEEVKYLGQEIKNCVVGEITDIKKHPDSDHLQICKLNCSEKFGTDIQIVTGAQNVFVGAKVPVALNGSTLAGGIKIKSGKLRGEVSDGMLCSGAELGITGDFYPKAEVDGILILPENVMIGTDIKDVVGINDYVFDISVTPNRPDCQSIFGMAREIAVILNQKVKPVQTSYITNSTNSYPLNLSVENNAVCPLYLGHIVDDVKLEQSPVWLRQRLIKCGINPINNVVDITNYVLLELGQPMHAFDYNKIKGGKIVVRNAKSGESILTLDEKEHNLTEKNLVIADGETPMAVAGIMGGEKSGINSTTNKIVLESAVFKRESIRKTSRALGLASDSSRRFEKGVDSFTTKFAMQRALHLVSVLGIGNITDVSVGFDLDPHPVNQIIDTNFSKINSILGIQVPRTEITRILTALEFNVIPTKLQDELKVEVPLFRTDLEGANDIAEEVIRIYGYHNIPAKLLADTFITKGGKTQEQKDRDRVKNILVNQGFNEIITYSFYGEKDLERLKVSKDSVEYNFIKIKNPLSEDYGIMRTMLLPSMLSIINKNIKKGIDCGRLFEIANVYIPREVPLTHLPIERQMLSLGMFGEDVDYFKARGVIEAIGESLNINFKFEPVQKPFFHPYRSVNIIVEGEAIGYLGQLAYDISEELSLKENIFLAEINFEKLAKNIKNNYTYKNITKHQSIKRDLAIVVNNSITVGEVSEIIKNASKKVTSIKLFDIYHGEQLEKDYKSLAFTITFTPDKEPLTAEDVDAQVNKILSKLKEKVAGTLR